MVLLMSRVSFFILLRLVSMSSFNFAQSFQEYELPLSWSVCEVGKEEWHNVILPSTVHGALIDNGILNHPFLGDGEATAQWIGERDWLYRCESFDMPLHLMKKQHLEMFFGGLDTYADVYLNGEKILYAFNAFRTWSVDVKDLVREKSNSLEIYFHSPIKRGKEKLSEIDYPLPGEELRAITRKPQFHYGWDWGPKLIGCGITGRVVFKVYNEIEMIEVSIHPKMVSEDYVLGEFKVELQSERDTSLTLVIKINEIEGLEPMRQTFVVKRGSNTLSTPFRIDDPKLWYCRGLGDPNMYQFSWQLYSSSELFETGDISTGFRNIELVRENDQFGESFYFLLNGKKVFVRGANYIPFAFFSEREPETMGRVLQAAADVNMNMIRVWGGGVYEVDRFYEQCDKLGLMVWQDFMFACSMYPVEETFMDNVKIEAEQQVKRLRNHPCIALWCGNNENAEAWERWGWQMGMSAGNKKTLKDGYDRLFHQILPDVVSAYSQTSYWPSSPLYGRGDNRHTIEGDAHYWGVWHDSEPFETFEEKIPRFMSEFGFQSFPSEAVVKEMTNSSDPSVMDSGFQSHQKHNRGFSLMQEYMARWMKPVKMDSIAKFVHASQVLQAEGIGMGIEAHLRNQPLCMGTMYWQLNDLWPAFSWSGMDYKGNWKALHFKLLDLYSNARVDIFMKDDIPSISVVNHGVSDLNCTLVLDHLAHSGERIFTWDTLVLARALEAGAIKILRGFKLKDNSYLRVRMIDEGGATISEDRIFGANDYMKDLTEPSLRLSTSIVGDNYLIEVSADNFAKGVFLQSNTKGKFSRNFVDIDGKASVKVLFIPERPSTPEFTATSLWDTYN